MTSDNLILTNRGVTTKKYMNNDLNCNVDTFKAVGILLNRVLDLIESDVMDWDDTDRWDYILKNSEDLEIYRKAMIALEQLYEAYNKYFPEQREVGNGVVTALPCVFNDIPISLSEDELSFGLTSTLYNADLNHRFTIFTNEPRILAVRQISLELRL